MERGWRTPLLLVVLALAAVGCAAPGTSPSPAGSRLVYGLTLAPSGIDPHIDVSSELGIPLSSVYDTLVYRSEEGEFLPMLAESWDVSEDGTVYTFRLRRGIRFHDGTDFDAAAVKRTLDRVADPNTGSRKAVVLLGPYEGCRVLDQYTLAVYLREPFAPLLDSFSQVYLAPASPAALDRWGDEYQFHQVGTGPYMMRDYAPNDHLTLVRNPAYVPPPGIFRHEGLPEAGEVEFRFLVEPAIRLLALEAGDADVVGEIPPQDAARIETSEDLYLVPTRIPGLPLVGFLNTTAFPTDDLDVRRALVLGADRTQLVRTVFGDYSPVAVGPLSHNHTHYSSAVEALYPEADVQQAAALLEEAGWTMADDGLRYRDGQPLQLQAYVMTWGLVPEVAELLQAQWRDLGVELVLNEVTFTAALAAVAENRHNLIFWSEPGTDGDLLRSFFHSESIGLRNWSGVTSAELDSLLDQARKAGDPEERTELYGRAQTLIMEEALILPIRDYVNLNGVRQCVSDLHFDSRGWFPVLHDLRLSGSCR